EDKIKLEKGLLQQKQTIDFTKLIQQIERFVQNPVLDEEMLHKLIERIEIKEDGSPRIHYRFSDPYISSIFLRATHSTRRAPYAETYPLAAHTPPDKASTILEYPLLKWTDYKTHIPSFSAVLLRRFARTGHHSLYVVGQLPPRLDASLLSPILVGASRLFLRHRWHYGSRVFWRFSLRLRWPLG